MATRFKKHFINEMAIPACQSLSSNSRLTLHTAPYKSSSPRSFPCTYSVTVPSVKLPSAPCTSRRVAPLFSLTNDSKLSAFRILPRCMWDLPSYGISRSVGWNKISFSFLRIKDQTWIA